MNILNRTRNAIQIKLIAKKIWNFMESKTHESVGQVFAFGIILTINYPLYYLIWLYGSHQTYENLPLRLSASALCLLLVVKNYWPKKLQFLFPFYWYSTVLYCLPFFFTFMTLQNHASAMWLMNTVSVSFFMLLLFDTTSALVLIALGTVFGGLFYKLTANVPFAYEPGLVNLYGIVATLGAAMIIGAIFSHNKEKIQNEKIRTICIMGESMAHELRTPLRTIHSGAEGLKGFLPQLMETYAVAKAADLAVPEVDGLHYDALMRTLDNITAEVQGAFTFINMLLVNTNEAAINRSYSRCSIATCVRQALEKYPFDTAEIKLVHWNNAAEFVFKGDEQLMSHVIFNLIKNALYYIKAVNKGEIYIWTEARPEANLLYFKDTGAGISRKIMPNIFERFFSKTYHGTGIGLAFCKLVMKSFGGDISCKSVEGQFTEFVMQFPQCA